MQRWILPVILVLVVSLITVSAFAETYDVQPGHTSEAHVWVSCPDNCPVYVTAVSSGTASSWASKSYLDFGEVYSSPKKMFFAIKVPLDVSPGTYTITWNFDCTMSEGLRLCDVPPSIFTINVQSSMDSVPDWIRNNAKWWANGLITDGDFTSGIEYMIKENIMVIPDLPENTQMELKDEKRAMGLERDVNVPDWIRNNAGWWVDGLIPEINFVDGIKWLVEQGIIRV